MIDTVTFPENETWPLSTILGDPVIDIDYVVEPNEGLLVCKYCGAVIDDDQHTCDTDDLFAKATYEHDLKITREF